jgi:hypothetical protein
MRKLLTVAFVAASLAFGALPVSAAGAETFTVVMKDVTATFPTSDPCTGAPATVTVTYNSVLHVTIRPGGTFDPVTFTGTNFSVTGTQAGTFTLISSDTFTGHFATWFGFNSNSQNEASTVTFNAVGSNAAGTAMISAHTEEHFNTTPSGNFNVFSKLHCNP